MNTFDLQETLVKESLFHFIKTNLPGANLNVIDDIFLSYVISILEIASKDACFDVDNFIEFMSAYMPEFKHVDSGLVLHWAMELENTVFRRADSKPIRAVTVDSADKVIKLLDPPPTKANRSHTSSESSECSERRLPVEAAYPEEYADQCRILTEMFPNTCAMEIKHCVSIAHGDLDRAIATLLHRREQGQALSAAALHSAAKQPLCDDHEIKNRIIARYSYVDNDAEPKEHKPLAPKIEPKKLVRYRDNKIVSLKGERYTEVPKSGIDEEHLKKPKKQHCP